MFDLGCHAGEAQAEASPVLNDLVAVGILERLEQVVNLVPPVVCVDQTEGIQGTAFAVRISGGSSALLRQVGLEQLEGLVSVALAVWYSGRGREINETTAKSRHFGAIPFRKGQGQEVSGYVYTVYLVDHSDRCGGREGGPVLGASEPLEVGAQEDVDGGAHVHDGVGHDGRVVRHAVASLELLLRGRG